MKLKLVLEKALKSNIQKITWYDQSMIEVLYCYILAFSVLFMLLWTAMTISLTEELVRV
jgi:hypothetical protein